LTQRKLRILFVPSWYPEPGYPIRGIFIKNHAQCLKEDADLQVLYAWGGPGLDFRIETKTDDGIPTTYVTFPFNGKSKTSIGYIIRYLRAIRKGYKTIIQQDWEPDLFHAHVAYPAALFCAWQARKEKKPFGITEHLDLYLREMHGLQKPPALGKWVRKKLAEKAAFMTVCSTSMKKAYEWIGVKREVSVVPNSINFATPPSPGFSQKEKKQLLHISTLRDHQKNVSGLLRGIHRLVQQGRTDFEMHILGSGDEMEQRKQLARELGLLGTIVFFHGFVPEEEKQRFLRDSHVYVMFSNYEGFSVVTAEAISSGLPVITTRCGGPDDFVTEENGLVISVGDEEALARAINYMLDNYEKYARIKMHEDMQQRFGCKAISRMFMELYRKALPEIT